MSKWREVRLGEVADVFSGFAFSSKDMQNKGVPIIKIGNIQNKVVLEQCEVYFPRKEILERHKKYFLKTGDILIAMTGAGSVGKVGKMFNSDGEYLVNQRVGIIRPRNDIDEMFLYYVLTMPHYENYLYNIGIGAGQPNISAKDIGNIDIPTPDLETQEKIAQVLSTYDELIENNNRRIQILEKSAEEIYKEWFVRMRFPGHENTKFEKGIPEGWEVNRIGDLVNISSSKRIYASDYVDEGVAFYRSKEVIQLARGETISEPLYISIDKYNELKEKFGVPIQDDILLTSVGTIGIPMLVKDDSPFYFKDGNLTWIQSNSRVELALYLYLWIKSEIGSQEIRASTIGTSQSALTIEKLKNIKILIPKINIIDVFNNISNKIQEQINNLQLQNQNLIKQRDLLLPRLMNGTIEVK